MMNPVYFDDLKVGDALPSLRQGPISTAHIMRWSAASENWHRIHFDREYAVEHDKLPNVIINGSWKQNVLVQLLTDWAGETGWLWKIGFQFRGMNLPGETLQVWGKILTLEDYGVYGLVKLEIGVLNDAENESTPGTATVVLPKRNGPSVPYPFDPSILEGKTPNTNAVST
jgi:acyl dehydratase